METIEELKNITQGKKRSKESFLLSLGYTVHRNISIYLTWCVLRYLPSLTPNAVSVLMILVGIAGGILVLAAEPWVQLVGLAVVYLSFLLDKVDGELARYKKVFTIRGVYLDEVYHIIVPVVLLTVFFFPLAASNTAHIVTLLVAVVLFIYRRLERKLYIIIAAKTERQSAAGELTYCEYSPKEHRFWNNIVFRLASVIERFDVLLAVLAVAILAEFTGVAPMREWILIIYAVLSIVYSVRWTALHYAGALDEKIKAFTEKGY